ncbi:uncharacterized protein CELE_B0285.3 [Caenorhabditis elegans]|uniref:Uncharacterized protein B0285.3 n=1 Tax=Caenorhabditis elegans TaxID=6239 RepID=YKG3_CAEEL|nr:Uncharacterized protein CELE_B0285.3 [Caenorhabditis elegans]P46553.1 RecName: Full=Uncharacterized protein B0285.3 [Caenorhabditis elegans]CAA84296.1 Uncharacterized protein CELE_B0285.3 [Caenorhabditis elegans]|eukprot:NP_497874.1 Uncharacterized protein CELE_B0285.3 [Caenorhabditis elegans]
MNYGNNGGGQWQPRGNNNWRPQGRGRGGGGWKGNDNRGGYRGGSSNDGGWSNFRDDGNLNFASPYQANRGNFRGNYRGGGGGGGGNQNNYGNRGRGRGGFDRGRGGGGGGNKNFGPIDANKCIIPSMWNNPWDALEKEYEQEYGVAITEKVTDPSPSPSSAEETTA